jgi:hypothetical protein
MAKKRPEFSFPELEHRGRNAILRSPEEVQAEQAMLDETSEAVPQPATSREADRTSSKSAQTTVRARTRAPKAVVAAPMVDRLRQKLRSKQHLSSYTFRFRPEELEQLDQLVAELNQTRASKLSKNDLARLAVSWLLADYEERGQKSLIAEVVSQE